MIILLSGGFDPLHVGHLRMIQGAHKIAPRVVIGLNSDAWLMRKKNYVFMPFDERREILDSVAGVTMVHGFDDADDTACSIIERIRPNYFGNGGDRTTAHPAEHALCAKYGIAEVFNVGGGKVQSSSALMANASEQYEGVVFPPAE